MGIIHAAASCIWTQALSGLGNIIVNSIPKAALIPTLWLLSFLGSFLIFPVSDAVQTAGVVTLLVSALGYVVSAGQLPFKSSPLTILISLLWAVAAVSVMCSHVPFVALTYFFFFSVFPLTFFLFSFENAISVLKPVRLMMLALAIGSLIQFYFMPQMLKAGGAHWPLEDNNSLAVLLASGALMFMGEALRGGKWVRQQIGAAAICFAGLMTTGGVAVFIGFFLVLGVFACLVKPPTYKPVVWFLGSVVFLMVAMTTSDTSVYHFMGSWSATVQVFTDTGLAQPNSVSGSRLIIWESGIEIFKNHVWTGTGIGTFFLYYPEFRSLYDDSAGFAAHNDLIQFAAEMGLFAPLFAVVIVGFVIYMTVRKLKNLVTFQDRINLLIPFAVFGLIIGHSLVNFNMYVLPTLMVVGLMLAIVNGHFSQRDIILNGNKKTVREAICFVVVMGVLIPLWGCYLSEYYTTKATDALADGNIQGFSDQLNLADKWSAGQNGRAVLQAARFASATDHNNRALELLDRAQSLNSQLVQIYVERARILSITDPAKGLIEAQKALRIDVGSLSVRMMMSDILEKMGKSDEGYAVLKEGLVTAPRSRNPILYYQMLAAKSLERMDLEMHKEMLMRIKTLQSLK